MSDIPITDEKLLQFIEECSKGNAGAVLNLLENDSNANIANHEGTTPLLAACANGRLSVVLILLDAGASPNLSNHRGEVPLFFASAKGHLEVMAKLLEAGADPNQKPLNGLSPLVLARNNIEMSTTLLFYGADSRAALTQIREKDMHGLAVERMEGWPRVPSLLALCVRAVQYNGMAAGVPPALLQMPDPNDELEREQRRRAREETADRRGEKRCADEAQSERKRQ